MTTACTICGKPRPPGRGGITCSHGCAIALRDQRYAERPRLAADELIHASHHHRIFGLSCAEFDALVERADRRCEFCGAEPQVIGQRRPATGLLIDHDHTTGRVRGLLCPRCNQHMRRVEEGHRPVTAREAAYLNVNPSERVNP